MPCAAAEAALEVIDVDAETLETEVNTESTAVAEESPSAVQSLQLANSIEQDESHDEHSGTTNH